MTPNMVFHSIKTDRFYLMNLYLTDSTIMILIYIALLKLNYSFDLNLSLSMFILISIFAIINGMVVASLLHNTSHSNLPNKFLNRIIGEYCGFYVLYGFSNFSLIHILHHQFSDEDLDPVNPKGMSFFVFLTAPMRYMKKTTKKYLRSVHGHHQDYEKTLVFSEIIFHIMLILRLGLWYFILGKSLFFAFYAPSFLTIVAVFAHINYVCHRDHEDGSVEIYNLNHNLYYKIANFFTMGGYFHKNHHINMKVFNPKNLATKRSRKKLVSVLPAKFRDPILARRYQYSGNVISKYFNINKVWGEGKKNRQLLFHKFQRHSTNWL